MIYMQMIGSEVIKFTFLLLLFLSFKNMYFNLYYRICGYLLPV